MLVEMDADGSHQPGAIALLLDALRDADLVLGSRYVPGGSVVNWPKSREWLSQGGNWYTRRALQIPLQDATGGYGPSVRRPCGPRPRRGGQRRLHLPGRPCVPDSGQGVAGQEVPIEFVEREVGDSKMNRKIVSEAPLAGHCVGRRERVAREDRREITAVFEVRVWVRRCADRRRRRPPAEPVALRAVPRGQRWCAARGACPSGCVPASPASARA